MHVWAPLVTTRRIRRAGNTERGIGEERRREGEKGNGRRAKGESRRGGVCNGQFLSKQLSIFGGEEMFVECWKTSPRRRTSLKETPFFLPGWRATWLSGVSRAEFVCHSRNLIWRVCNVIFFIYLSFFAIKYHLFIFLLLLEYILKKKLPWRNSWDRML